MLVCCCRRALARGRDSAGSLATAAVRPGPQGHRRSRAQRAAVGRSRRRLAHGADCLKSCLPAVLASDRPRAARQSRFGIRRFEWWVVKDSNLRPTDLSSTHWRTGRGRG